MGHLDTWKMKVKRLEGTYSGSFRIPLPSRQYKAIRLVRVTDGLNV
ncbi:DUF5605 domain-containing protein [Demequina lutea]|uniref:DUF5605 domain-containing protein n=1 Tax=Demequina lutea TaxID=431489 RepID=A0A7Y9ZA68_9MICO|nr:DUF5605 domain-containing protein [Demequina lutea]NYI40833.1 hypothetical protein [Demequina lutea]